jgi:1-phosphofructokinase family hexose kinase
MILSITPNPALDRILTVPGFLPGTQTEHTEAITIAAGKGVSVARAARTLGADTLCAGFLGGVAGRHHKELLEREKLPFAWTSIEAETRTCYIIVDPKTRKSTVINEPGPTVSSEDWNRFSIDILQLAERAAYISFSGSLPVGSPLEAYHGLIRALTEAGHFVWIDVSGAALQTAIDAAPMGVKVNGSEMAAFLGVSINTVAEAAEAATTLRQKGIKLVGITLGELGAVIVSAEGAWWARPPALEIVSAVGSGDSFLGGLLTALTKGADLPEALRTGVAAGGANALSLGAGYFSKIEFDTSMSATMVQRL